MNIRLRQFAFALSLSLSVAGCANDPQVLGVSSVTIGASPYMRGDLSTLTVTAQVGRSVRQPAGLRSGMWGWWQGSAAYSNPAFLPSREPSG